MFLVTVNGAPKPPEHSLVQEMRQELAHIRDRVNYLLDRLDLSQDTAPAGYREDSNQTGVI